MHLSGASTTSSGASEKNTATHCQAHTIERQSSYGEHQRYGHTSSSEREDTCEVEQFESLIMTFDDFGFFNTDDYSYDALPSGRTRRRIGSFCDSTTAKILRMVLFGILLPILCIVVPVYAKYVWYAESVVTFGASDMRIVDGQVSTIWCQGQELRMNASFEAYLMNKAPPITPKAQHLSMIRHFELDDDTKEYWGFYLLRGSEVSVSSCARHLGANVMMIKGISSLKFCAYVGQESNEHESSEIFGLEAHKLLEQYDMANEGFKAPPPPMFTQPKKTDRARILQLLKTRNEKRRLIKLLERNNINTNGNDTFVPGSAAAQVEEALQNLLQQEIKLLYQEVKNILNSNDATNRKEAATASKTVKNKWPVKNFNEDGAKLSAVLNEEVGSDEDGAFELGELNEGQLNTTSDGIADDRGTIDHNHANDTSQSNEESSFSSSEEAMLHCRGVLLSQPLVPESQCSNSTNPTKNTIHYTVEEDGYYYFIFSSANEKVRNRLTVKFDLVRTIFNVSEAVDVCHNSTHCHFPLNFYSSERVVVALPAPESNLSPDWDQTFKARSICEPRMPIYLGFVLLLPLVVVFCAFR